MNYVRTSDPQFAAGWYTLPKPDPFVGYERLGVQPIRKGVFEVRASFVDEHGGVTEMGPTTTLSLMEGHRMFYRPNLPRWTRAVGLILWGRRIDAANVTNALELEWRPFAGHAGMTDPVQAVKPYIPLTGWNHHSLRAIEIDPCIWFQGGGAWHPFEDKTFWPVSSDPAPSSAPDVQLLYVSNIAREYCHAWACHVGESPRSESFLVPASSAGPVANSPVELTRVEIPPHGALGMYVYSRDVGSTCWKRVPVRHDANEFLWPLTANRVTIEREPETIDPYQPVPNPDPQAPDPIPPVNFGKSWLTPIQQCLRLSTGSVIVDDDQIIYCPIVSQLNNAYGPCLYRVIQGEQGLPFKVKTGSVLPSGQTFPLNWAMWVEGSLGTNPRRMTLESTTAEVGIDFMDHGGSGSFFFNGEYLAVNLTRAGYTAGIRQTWEGRSPNNHSLSDSEFNDLRIGAAHPVVIEGNQSLNIKIRKLNATCGDQTTDSSIISLNNYSGLTVEGMTVEGGRAMMTVLNANQCQLSEVFTDQGYPCYFCVLGWTGPRITCLFKKLNHFFPWLHVVENVCSGRPQMSLAMQGDEAQYNGIVDTLIYSQRYAGVKYSLPLVGLFDFTRLQQTPLDVWRTVDGYAGGGSFCSRWDGGQDVTRTIIKPNQYGLNSSVSAL